MLTRAAAEADATDRALSDVLAETPELRGRYTAEELARIGDPAGYLGAAGTLVDGAVVARVAPEPARR